MTLEELELVHVEWGEYQGLVSLTLRATLVAAHTWRDCFDVPAGVSGFVSLTNDEMGYDGAEGADWSGVPDYLDQHRDGIVKM